MAEYWEPIYERAMATNAVWSEFGSTFTVGLLTIAHQAADIALFVPAVTARDEAEDDYDQAVDARDANLYVIERLNVRAVGVIRGNLSDDDALHSELDDVNGMVNEGSGKIMARGRKLATLWAKVNVARANGTPVLPAIQVGGKAVAVLDAALAGHEALLKAVQQKLSAWSSKRSDLKAIATRVDRNNKRWYEAWSNNYDPGSPEIEALSQINTGPGAPALPGPVTATIMHDAEADVIHIDASAPHATHFRVFRQAPGETEYIERAANEESPIEDPVTLPGVYRIKLQARNGAGDGPLGEAIEVTVTV